MSRERPSHQASAHRTVIRDYPHIWYGGRGNVDQLHGVARYGEQENLSHSKCILMVTPACRVDLIVLYSASMLSIDGCERLGNRFGIENAYATAGLSRLDAMLKERDSISIRICMMARSSLPFSGFQQRTWNTFVHFTGLAPSSSFTVHLLFGSWPHLLTGASPRGLLPHKPFWERPLLRTCGGFWLR